MTMLAVPIPPPAPSQQSVPVPEASIYRPSWRALAYGAGLLLWPLGVVLAVLYDASLGVLMATIFLPPGIAIVDVGRLEGWFNDELVQETPTHIPCCDCADLVPRQDAVIDDGIRCRACDALPRASYTEVA